jgi:hypothetical protein
VYVGLLLLLEDVDVAVAAPETDVPGVELLLLLELEQLAASTAATIKATTSRLHLT